MDKKRFFEIIMTVCNWDAAGDDDKVLEPLIEYLAKQSDETIFLFDEIMAELLYKLDTRKNYEMACKCDTHNDDTFLYSRCVALINGEDYYNKVKAGKISNLWKMEFESILYVPMWSWGKKHGKSPDDYSYCTAKSYETGSNVDGWSRY